MKAHTFGKICNSALQSIYIDCTCIVLLNVDYQLSFKKILIMLRDKSEVTVNNEGMFYGYFIGDKFITEQFHFML